MHVLTPGHGKAALAAYFLGREAHAQPRLAHCPAAALLHVLSGFGMFLVFRFIVGQAPSMMGPPLTFTIFGYSLIISAGMIMIVQSLRSGPDLGRRHAFFRTRIGLLPCPLTISVLGFAWTQRGTATLVWPLASR